MLKHKFHATRCEHDGIKFASKKERNRYLELQQMLKNGEIEMFLRQTPFHLKGGVKYVCDFQVFHSDGYVRFEDVKGFRTDLYKLKKKQVEATYPIEIIEILKMKKYLLMIILMINGVANADNNAYLKASIGMNHIPKQKIKDNRLEGSLKLRQSFPVIGVGIGYEFDDLLRIETVFDYYFLFTQLEKSRIDTHTFNVNLNTEISDLMVNVIKEVKLSNKSNIFIGGGVGVSSIQDEATGYSHAQNSEYEILQPVHGKHVYRFAYKITTGIDYQLREGVKGEIAYNFYNLGKNKSVKIDNIDNIKNRRFLIHNLTLGLRFDI